MPGPHFHLSSQRYYSISATGVDLYFAYLTLKDFQYVFALSFFKNLPFHFDFDFDAFSLIRLFLPPHICNYTRYSRELLPTCYALILPMTTPAPNGKSSRWQIMSNLSPRWPKSGLGKIAGGRSSYIALFRPLEDLQSRLILFCGVLCAIAAGARKFSHLRPLRLC